MRWKTLLSFPFSVAPDAIYSHVKTRKEEARNMHYIAPEYAGMCDLYVAEDCCLIKVRKKILDSLKIRNSRSEEFHCSDLLD